MLADRPWIGLGPHNRWDRAPRIDLELGANLDPRLHLQRTLDSDEDARNYVDDDLR